MITYICGPIRFHEEMMADLANAGLVRWNGTSNRDPRASQFSREPVSTAQGKPPKSTAFFLHLLTDRPHVDARAVEQESPVHRPSHRR